MIQFGGALLTGYWGLVCAPLLLQGTTDTQTLMRMTVFPSVIYLFVAGVCAYLLFAEFEKTIGVLWTCAVVGVALFLLLFPRLVSFNVTFHPIIWVFPLLLSYGCLMTVKVPLPLMVRAHIVLSAVLLLLLGAATVCLFPVPFSPTGNLWLFFTLVVYLPASTLVLLWLDSRAGLVFRFASFHPASKIPERRRSDTLYCFRKRQRLSPDQIAIFQNVLTCVLQLNFDKDCGDRLASALVEHQSPEEIWKDPELRELICSSKPLTETAIPALNHVPTGMWVESAGEVFSKRVRLVITLRWIIYLLDDNSFHACSISEVSECVYIPNTKRPGRLVIQYGKVEDIYRITADGADLVCSRIRSLKGVVPSKDDYESELDGAVIAKAHGKADDRQELILRHHTLESLEIAAAHYGDRVIAETIWDISGKPVAVPLYDGVSGIDFVSGHPRIPATPGLKLHVTITPDSILLFPQNTSAEHGTIPRRSIIDLSGPHPYQLKNKEYDDDGRYEFVTVNMARYKLIWKDGEGSKYETALSGDLEDIDALDKLIKAAPVAGSNPQDKLNVIKAILQEFKLSQEALKIPDDEPFVFEHLAGIPSWSSKVRCWSLLLPEHLVFVNQQWNVFKFQINDELKVDIKVAGKTNAQLIVWSSSGPGMKAILDAKLRSANQFYSRIRDRIKSKYDNIGENVHPCMDFARYWNEELNWTDNFVAVKAGSLLETLLKDLFCVSDAKLHKLITAAIETGFVPGDRKEDLYWARNVRNKLHNLNDHTLIKHSNRAAEIFVAAMDDIYESYVSKGYQPSSPRPSPDAGAGSRIPL